DAISGTTVNMTIKIVSGKNIVNKPFFFSLSGVGPLNTSFIFHKMR
ncbi:unnamed protein product, partial [marine sediment metagenome]